ncbi:DNA polymerase III subunit delta' [Sphingomonas sp.]|uniref:DNA polymerase III subunit delta' n=1 Tax=Sphingomonas sp. TaxID=28214 RepID=UPI0017E611C9|nr:DNA polymerase III subunit delta' [Sphingomonas sp.]MBA3511832.1 DNA polymerase III subunit delta' [Sphingomonas sp.]
MIAGHEKAVAQFKGARAAGTLHHAWLLAGPRGVGKAHFARLAATRVLADAAGPLVELPGLETPEEHPIAKLVAAGSHPDMRWLERIENPKKPGVLFKNILVDQIRGLAELFEMSPAMSEWRVAVIDTVDELEASGGNALLKMLEEPPANCLFLLVSHAPGRLLPTIRSRCRRLDFRPLADDAMTSLLEVQLPSLKEAERSRIVARAGGSVGRALAFAALDLAKLEEAATRILREGDPTNARRSDLAIELGRRGAGERYAAFLELVPSLIARQARGLEGPQLGRALDAYARSRELAVLAPRVSLDPASTVFQLGGILASVAPRPVP